MKSFLTRYAWAFVYVALIFAGLTIALWLANYTDEGAQSQQQEEDCLRRPRKLSPDCGELEP